MMARVNLAGEGTTLTTAASVQAPAASGWEHIDDGHATRPSALSQGRVVRMREQVSALLEQMPDDAAERGAGGQDSLPSGSAPDVGTGAEGFWRPDDEGGQAAGYRSKHRLAGPPKDHGPKDGRRSKPRHAAPPASLIAMVGRRLASVRLTGHYAAHAA